MVARRRSWRPCFSGVYCQLTRLLKFRIPFGTLEKDTNSYNLVKWAEVIRERCALSLQRSGRSPIAQVQSILTAPATSKKRRGRLQKGTHGSPTVRHVCAVSRPGGRSDQYAHQAQEAPPDGPRGRARGQRRRIESASLVSCLLAYFGQPAPEPALLAPVHNLRERQHLSHVQPISATLRTAAEKPASQPTAPLR